MKINSITIKNVLGIREYTLEADDINEIVGPNASGKSSILEAIRAALNGGNLSTLKNVHEEGEAETVLVIDDGKFRLERTGDKVNLLERVGDTAAYEKVRRPQTVINDWFDKDLSNPFRFLTAPPKERVDLFLEALPIAMTPEQLRAAVGDDLWPTVSACAQAGGHPLTVLARAREAIYTERTGVNVSERDKRASAQELKKSIPATMPASTPEGISAAEKERDELGARIANEEAAAEIAYRTAVTEAQAAHEKLEADERGAFKAAAAKVKGAAEQEIRSLEAEMEAAIAKLRQAFAAAAMEQRATAQAEVDRMNDAGAERIHESYTRLEATRAEAAARRAERQAAVDKDVQRLRELSQQLSDARAARERATELRKTKELADKFDGEASSLKGKADRLTAGLNAVDALKVELLKDLPIKGVEVVDKDIRVDGVPFDQVNLSNRLELASDLVILRAKRFPLAVAFIDGFEAFDKKHRAIVFKKFAAAGVQLFTGRVVDEARSVNTMPRETAGSAA